MTERKIRLHCCCFTGHRPEKLQHTEAEIKAELKIQIDRAASEGFTTFITGMAPGVDIFAAEIVLNFKAKSDNIKLICALPYPDFCMKKDEEYRKRADKILESADEVKSVCPSQSKYCYLTRDRWMVDRSSLVIAVFNGSEGGTKYTLDYAKKKNVKVINIIQER